MELVQKTSFFGLAAGIGPWTLSFVTAHFRAQPSAFLNYDCAHRHDMAWRWRIRHGGAMQGALHHGSRKPVS